MLVLLFNLKLITEKERDNLLTAEQDGSGRALSRILGMNMDIENGHKIQEAGTDHIDKGRSVIPAKLRLARRRILHLALEALRLEVISRGKFRDHGYCSYRSAGHADRPMSLGGRWVVEEIRKKIGARLRTLRQERHLTQEEKAVDETDESLSFPIETAVDELVPPSSGMYQTANRVCEGFYQITEALHPVDMTYTMVKYPQIYINGCRSFRMAIAAFYDLR